MRYKLLSSVAFALSLSTVASAQVTMTFAPACATGLVQGFGPTFSEAGFTLSSTGIFGLAAWCADDANDFAGPAIFANTQDDIPTVTRDGGGVFSIQSIDLAQLGGGVRSAQLLSFVGHLFGGGTVTQTFTLAAGTSAPPVFATFAFDPSFANLTSVDFAAQSDPFYQLTNVKLLGTTATPEPASIALVATGLIGMTGVARRRRRTTV